MAHARWRSCVVQRSTDEQSSDAVIEFQTLAKKPLPCDGY